ncbi:MAG TPA: hypothetical protein VKU00_07060 [Chthonomonadaceae bacterium]|nr:hypothetical protein [Chthonomonadaceae bacterium]
MKNVLYLIGAIIIVAILWKIVTPLIFMVGHLLFGLVLIGLFVAAVYAVYKALNREKLTL